VRRDGDRVLLIVADGLGHGPDAAAASTQAIRLFQTSSYRTPADLLAEMHAALRSTRGAAVAVASLDPNIQEIRYAGIGNISASVVDGEETRSMVSHNGTLGHEMRKIQEFRYSWPAGALVVMHSDGLQTSWRLDRYPGLTSRNPSVIAGTLYRDFSRGRDDVTVLAVRRGHPDGGR
jgi:serine phosphatase RsbU (regulator of sigma subunit)